MKFIAYGLDYYLDCLSGCPGSAKAPLRSRKEKELLAFGRRGGGGHNEGAQLGVGIQLCRK